MSDAESFFKDAGNELIEYSQNYGEDELRSRSELLFPAIFIASQRMSGRAISRWLQDDQSIKFSPAAVANVLRDQESYFKAIAERIQPLAEHVANAYGLGLKEYLYDETQWAVIEHLTEEGRFERQIRMHEGLPDIQKYLHSVQDELKEDWFGLDQQIRFRCLPYFDFGTKQDEENEETQSQ